MSVHISMTAIFSAAIKKRSPVPATSFYEKNYVLEKQLIIFGRNLAYQCKVYEKV